MTYEILPITLQKRTRTNVKPSKYPFAALEVGQGFFERDVVDAKKVAAKLLSAANSYRKTVGEGAPRFTVQVQDENGVDVVAVVRVADKEVAAVAADKEVAAVAA